eukprot:scaffold1516_cov266-Prasinococcus_capsulatus_cf.AAC.5
MLLGSEPTCMPEQWEEVGKRLAKDADILSVRPASCTPAPSPHCSAPTLLSPPHMNTQAGEWREMPFYSPGGKEGLLARQCPRTQQLLDACACTARRGALRSLPHCPGPQPSLAASGSQFLRS